MQYRPEIDGLRALAVLPVILFHTGYSTFAGGFVGVDVFFVISGYLITTIIHSDLESGRFSVAKFYERRARRILPALFFIIACCLPFAWFWMLPQQLVDFGKALIAVVFFVSNVLFWQQSGYFAAATEENPLLHTWSLAVEEQFYIGFPLLMLMLWRLRRSALGPVILLLCLVSLGMAEWWSRTAPSANFYLLPSRIWELGIGALCALWLLRRPARNNQILATVGLMLILVSMLTFDSETRFPSVWGLLPVGGTALIILFCTSKTLVGRLLTLRPMVFVGLISYSAYLWHQPLFAFARLRAIGPVPVYVMAGLALLSLLLAAFTWYFIERPFRVGGKRLFDSRTRIFVLSAVAGGTIALVGVVAVMGNGFPTRSERIATLGDLEHRLRDNRGLSGCDNKNLPGDPLCASGANPEIAIWGDSHAMHIVPMFQARADGPAFQQIAMGDCAPLLGIAQYNSSGRDRFVADCIAQNDRALAWIEQSPRIHTVVLSSALSLIGREIVDRNGNHFSRDDDKRSSPEHIAQALGKVVHRLQASGRRVVVIGRTPRAPQDSGNCLMRAVLNDRALEACDFDAGSPSRRKNMAVIEALPDDVPVIRLDEAMCDEDRCHASADGVFLLRDVGHLAIEGAEYLALSKGLDQIILKNAR